MRLLGIEETRPVKKMENSLRASAKVVSRKNVSNVRSQGVAMEMILRNRVSLPGVVRGGCLAAPQIGTPSRLIVLEDPQGAIDDLTEEERELYGRHEPFGPKAIFNPSYKAVGTGTTVLWEKSKSLPGYKALVERPTAVKVKGLDPTGKEVRYVAKGWEAREIQKATDALDGRYFIDTCIMRSLRYLDAPEDPLPADVPPEGKVTGDSRPPLTQEQIDNAETKDVGFFGTTAAGFFSAAGLTGPPVSTAGSLILRLTAREVTAEEIQTGAMKDVVDLLRKAWDFEEHPLGVAAPQLGRSVRAVLVGERAEVIEELKLPKRVQKEQQRLAYGPKLLFNPVVTPKGGDLAYFYESSASVPSYRAVVGRHVEVDVQGLDEDGRAVRFSVSGWPARMWQHVTDVLDGVLYVDRMESISFALVKSKEPVPEGCPYGIKRQAAGKKATTAASAAARRAPRRRAAAGKKSRATRAVQRVKA